MRYDPLMFNIYEGINREEFIIAFYYIEIETGDILKRVESIAKEQSTGTWTDLPEETIAIKEGHEAKVIGIYEIPDYECMLPKDIRERRFFIQIAYPVKNIGYQLPELLTTLYGEISMVGRIKLLDILFPESFIENFKGPKFGIDGIRKILNLYNRPIICGMFKPSIGATPKTLGRLFYEMGIGGVDIVKDDELLADPEISPVDARLEECVKAKEQVYAETGRRVLYAINITDSPDKMHRKGLRVVKNGADCLMVNTYTVGFGALSELAEDPEINVPIMTHPAMAGTLFESPDIGFTSNIILAKLPRLSGSDMVIYPGPYGKVPLLKERGIRVAQELTSPFYHIKRAFPGPSAGIHPGLVPVMIEEFGIDLIIGAGGGIHGHPEGIIAGLKAFHQAIDACIKDIPLKDAALKNKELRSAIEKWGIYNSVYKENLYGLTG